MLQELIEWKRARDIQQIKYPLDDASKGALGALSQIGNGTPSDSDFVLTGNAQTISFPVATSTITVTGKDGTQYTLLCQ